MLLTLLLLLGLYLLILAVLYLFQRHLIYLPSGDPGEPPAGLVRVEARTADGLSSKVTGLQPAGMCGCWPGH